MDSFMNKFVNFILCLSVFMAGYGLAHVVAVKISTINKLEAKCESLGGKYGGGTCYIFGKKVNIKLEEYEDVE